MCVRACVRVCVCVCVCVKVYIYSPDIKMSLTSQENEESMGIYDYSINCDMNVLLRLRKLSQNEDPALANKDYESLDYDWCFNKPYRAMLQEKQKRFPEVRIELVKWVVTFFVGFLTAMVALFIDSIVKLLNSWKFSTINKSIEECSMKGCLALSLVYLLLFDVLFVSLASCLTLYEPVAKGSGIPEIKCYLNGVRIPRVVRLRTLLSKAIGVLFSVAGGLFVGKEGPMIHSGAIIGAGVPQTFMKSDLFAKYKIIFINKFIVIKEIFVDTNTLTYFVFDNFCDLILNDSENIFIKEITEM
ncbi:chloride transport protein 6-like [Octopus sinensis]|uniref:Chloride transport protein 6-like n=1 Tax=Octopus sinensis TaxID=2607531 RepID=A0A6P7TN54_9MOLL|nr:chloride transport protein 6-like [Octopus sinensis]